MAEHAIVIGAGMAGLLSARVLSEYFQRVTVLERTRLSPSQQTFQSGALQGRHAHLLLSAGRTILESLFPGLDAELGAEGAPLMDFCADSVLLTENGLVPRYPSGLILRLCSRGLLEGLLRRRVALNPRVRIVDGCDVVGLVGAKRRISGVRVRYQAQNGESSEREEMLYADWIVGADGRFSRIHTWLDELGYLAPQEAVVDAFVGYSSRFYQLPDVTPLEQKLIVDFAMAPERPRGALLMAVEANRCIVTFSGVGRRYPPMDEDGFLQFAKNLRLPIFYEIIQRAEPISPIFTYRRTENRFRHYERLPRFPERFVVLGDAAVSLDPVYGQGMTVAAQSARALEGCLRETRNLLTNGLAQRVQTRAARTCRDAWMLATAADLQWPEAEGERPNRLGRFLQLYTQQLVRFLPASRAISQEFFEVQHGVKPISALFRPTIVAEAVKLLASRRSPG